MATRKIGFAKFRELEGEEGIKRIATEYAVTDIFTKMEQVSDKFGVNEKGLRDCIAYAIENCLISYRLAIECKRKANFNQRRHIKDDSVVKSDQYYEGILRKRMEYVKAIKDERVSKIAQLYISCPKFRLAEIADAVGFSIAELSEILKHAIILGLVSKEDANKIRNIAINKTPYSQRERTVTTFKRYMELRKLHEDLEENVRFYEFQVSTYDSARIDEEGAPQKDDLESHLETARKNLADFEKSF